MSPLTRRQALGMFAGSVVSQTMTGDAQSPAKGATKGPLVFLDYDQAELDSVYDQDVWAPNANQVRARMASDSVLTRARIGEPRRVSYGPTPIEQLDIFRTAQANSPIQLYLHGGAWRRGRASDYSFLAEPFVRTGAHVVIPDFSWAQDVNGSLLTIAVQIRRAIAWTYRNASEFGGDVTRFYITGHSSGGHLAAVALTTDWTQYGLPPSIFKAATCVSGIYDLKGARLSSRREYVRFDDETESTLSPMRHIETIACPVAVAYSSLDSREFQRQSREFADALKQRGRLTTLVQIDGYNHFEEIETLGNPYGILGRLVLQQMQLA